MHGMVFKLPLCLTVLLPLRSQCQCCKKEWGCCSNPCLMVKSRANEWDGGYEEMQPHPCQHDEYKCHGDAVA